MKTVLLAATALLAAANANAVPLYLNQANISVAVGAGTTATTSNNTFNGGHTIQKVIDAASASALEFHDQDTHIWFSGGGLELKFDFGLQYDLTTLHFWNYTGEGFDVDNIAFSFFDALNASVGSLSISPALGSSPGIAAQNIVLAAPLNVRYVTAFLTGSNGEVDFQNLGFTASLSTDRCVENPQDPICLPTDPTDPTDPVPVPEPTSLSLLGAGFAALEFVRRKRKNAQISRS